MACFFLRITMVFEKTVTLTFFKLVSWFALFQNPSKHYDKIKVEIYHIKRRKIFYLYFLKNNKVSKKTMQQFSRILVEYQPV